jgi:hypothetical protein
MEAQAWFRELNANCQASSAGSKVMDKEVSRATHFSDIYFFVHVYYALDGGY